jgi:iron complex outermembrane receptor protein
VKYYETKIKTLATTDLEVAYRLTKSLTASAGANNLFNKYPNKVNQEYIAAARAALNTAAVTQYPGFSPIGINGGYYYARMNYTF